jgi:hypothetical protein
MPPEARSGTGAIHEKLIERLLIIIVGDSIGRCFGSSRPRAEETHSYQFSSKEREVL